MDKKEQLKNKIAALKAREEEIYETQKQLYEELNKIYDELKVKHTAFVAMEYGINKGDMFERDGERYVYTGMNAAEAALLKPVTKSGKLDGRKGSMYTKYIKPECIREAGFIKL